jgi:hypothetical protein
MTLATNNGVTSKSKPTRGAIRLQSIAGIASGSNALFQLNTLKTIESDAAKNGWRLMVHSFVVTVRQTVTVAAAPDLGTGPFYASMAQRRALDVLQFQNNVIGSDYMMQRSGDTQSPSAWNFVAENYVNPVEFSLAVRDIPECQTPFPEYDSDDMAYGVQGLQGSDSNGPVDSRSSFWGLTRRRQTVAALNGGGAVTEPSNGDAPADYVVCVTSLASAQYDGDGQPSSLFGKDANFGTITYQPNNNTALYAPGTVFGTFEVSLWVNVSYVPIDGKFSAGLPWYCDRNAFSLPYSPAQTDHTLLLWLGPIFNSTATDTKSVNYSPRYPVQIPDLSGFFGANSKFQWFEQRSATGQNTQIEPQSNSYPSPRRCVEIANSAALPMFGVCQNKYGSKYGTYPDGVATTLLSDTIPGSQPFTAAGRTNGGLTNLIGPLSKLPAFPMLWVCLGMPGFPGGPYNGGDTTCSPQIRFDNITGLAAPFLDNGQFSCIRVRNMSEHIPAILASTECGCKGEVPSVPKVDNPESPKAEAVKTMVPAEVPAAVVQGLTTSPPVA